MSPISSPPRGMTSRAIVSPTRKMPYSPAALARPRAISAAPMRRRRTSPSVARAKAPSTSPVAVMRSQKRSRGPRNVRPNAANAAPMPAARSFTGSTGEKRGDDHAHDEQITERGADLGCLEVDHRDRALLPGRAELGRADLPHEEGQRQHREQRPGRQEAGDHRGGECEIRADDE